MNNFNKLRPFPWFCINNFPFIEQTFDEINIWNLLGRVVGKLNEVIENTNKMGGQVEVLTELVNQLKEYMEHYFDNLDVQEEINNKLDEMVEDGTLENILMNYTNISKVYETAHDLFSDDNLTNNQKIKTYGFYSIGDGGQADYIIKSTQPTSPYINLQNGLYAELIVQNNTINVKQLGAYGDGIHDDSDACKNAFDFARTNTNINEIHFPSGKYLINETILSQGIDGLIVSGENADYDGNLNSTIVRNSDCTILNASGSISLTGRTMCRRMKFKNLYITDSSQNFNEIAIKLHYSMYFEFEDCLFACFNKQFNFRNLYDTKFINCDFTSGGNSSTNSGLINIDCGKHASPTEVGWDNSNSITFAFCRFERFRGSAFKVTPYTQPETYNTTYDPCVGVNPNKLFLDICKFESPYLTDKPVLDFINTNTIYFNIEITALDGQPDMSSIVNFDNVSGVTGQIKASYYRTTVVEQTYTDFENPILKLNNSNKFNLNLIVGNIYSHYLLDYFVHVTANDLSYRTINISCPYSYKNKKIFNSSSIPLQSGHQSTIDTYGESSNNGIKMLYDNTIADEWKISSQYTNNKHQLRFLYKYGNQSSINPILINGDSDGVNNIQYNVKTTHTKGIELSRETTIEDNTSRSNRYIGYGSSAPSEGFWLKGDIIFNNNPSSGGYVGWVCVSGGSNSTWLGFGSIE